MKKSLHYILKDHLGSWTVIANDDGVLEQELSYDAWGNQRDPETWTGSSTIKPMFDRGFTGHEHMSAFGLINMNGRCYDPVVSSFLSVDAYVQSPESAQGFNRYSYCQNNPLRYTDPTGWQMVGGNRPDNPFHEDWSVSHVQHAYTPRDFGLMQLSDADPIVAWMAENEMQGGGSPIYDVNGFFLGTDDGGLRGEAIVMRKEDFRQNMKHEDALALATDLDANDKDAEIRFYMHFSQLRNRPDWDGYLTKSEADDWWLHGKGESLFVDMERIDLHGITSSFFHNETGLTKTKNFIWHFPLTETGKTYGTLTLTLINASTGEIKIGPKGYEYIDKYDFSLDGRFYRDVATLIGKPKGNGVDFLIYGYGYPKVPIKF